MQELTRTRQWSDDEDEYLRKIIESGKPLYLAAEMIGRSYGATAQRASKLFISTIKIPQKRDPKRGSGYDKASIKRHLKTMTLRKIAVIKHARSHGMDATNLVNACRKMFPDEWSSYISIVNPDIETSACPYCRSEFIPNSGRQTYCTTGCSNRARVDREYFAGNRRSTIGLVERICQLCGRHVNSGLSSHHVIGKERDPDGKWLIALCPGCHKAVTFLQCRKFIDDEMKCEALLSLASLQRHGSLVRDILVSIRATEES